MPIIPDMLNDKIFDDFLGYDLVPKELRERIEQQIIPEIFTRNQYYCQPCKVHRRYPSRSYQARSKAICNFGAGMDAYAFRRSDLMEQLRVFEVDHPTTQEYKLRRFAELGWKYTENLHFIPIDFTNT